jgi:hypothetical protein
MQKQKISHAGTRTRVYRVKADYPNHLDYMGPTLQSKLFTTYFVFVFCLPFFVVVTNRKQTKRENRRVYSFVGRDFHERLAPSQNRTGDLRIMRPTLYQRSSRSDCSQLHIGRAIVLYEFTCKVH